MEDAGRTGRGAGDGSLPGSDAMLDEARSGAEESAASNPMDPDHAPRPGSGRGRRSNGGEDSVLAVESVACDDLHDFEVFAVAPYPAEPREPFPGSDEVLVTSLELYAGRMERYVGAPMWVSGLDVYTLVPTRTSWVTGDREVACALTSLDASPIGRSMRATGGVVQDGYRSIFGLELGDCFDGSDESGYIVQLAPCDGPHDNEVFAVLQHPGSADDPYPGDGDLAIYASDACRRSAELAVDPTAAPSLGIGWMTRPVDLTWRLGQREISCILWDAGFEKIQGSRRAAGSG